ncbi:hypothetical protein EDC40_1071, partial [Aminobacter aminovorans]
MASNVEQNPENHTKLHSPRRESTSENAVLDGKSPADAVSIDALPDIVDVVMAMGWQAEPMNAPQSDAVGSDDKAPSPTLPSVDVMPAGGLVGQLGDLAERARGYVEAASSANTRRAYGADWKHFSDWARRQGFATMPPDPETVGLYITALASGAGGDKKSVSTIERRLSSLAWNYAQRGAEKLDRKHRAIA